MRARRAEARVKAKQAARGRCSVVREIAARRGRPAAARRSTGARELVPLLARELRAGGDPSAVVEGARRGRCRRSSGSARPTRTRCARPSRAGVPIIARHRRATPCRTCSPRTWSACRRARASRSTRSRGRSRAGSARTAPALAARLPVLRAAVVDELIRSVLASRTRCSPRRSSMPGRRHADPDAEPDPARAAASRSRTARTIDRTRAARARRRRRRGLRLPRDRAAAARLRARSPAGRSRARSPTPARGRSARRRSATSSSGREPSGPGPTLCAPRMEVTRDGLDRTPEAHELLLIEEADAWFEYLEATRAQSTSGTSRSSPGPGRGSRSGCARSGPGARKLRPAAEAA